MAYVVMENQSGRRRRVPVGFSWSTLLLGFFVPLSRGHWEQSIRSLILSACSLGVYWFVHPFLSNALYRSHLYDRGYRAVALAGIDISELERGLGLELKDISEVELTNQADDGSDNGKSIGGLLRRYWAPLFLAALLIVSITLGAIESARLSNLRESDPAAYLAEIEDEPSYMDELKTLDPAKYDAIIGSQWEKLFGAGRKNSADYVEDLYTALMLPEDALIRNVNAGIIRREEFQRHWYNNRLYERTIPYAKRRIAEGDFDILIERGIILNLSVWCEEEPGFSTVENGISKGWPLVENLNWGLESHGYAPFAGDVMVGAWRSFDTQPLLHRTYFPEPDDLTASCATLHPLVTQNRFYNTWDIESPELASQSDSS